MKVKFLTHSELVLFGIFLVVLIALSGFFSCAETALMAINRYRLRHKAKMKRSYAILILKLLKRPDRLLGTILIGNNFTNILAASFATIIAGHFWGEKGALLTSVGLAFIVLILAEIAPKTIAALYPDKVAKFVAWPVYVLQNIFYPLVWLANVISNGLLRLVGIKKTTMTIEPLTRDELRSIVYDSSRFSRDYQNMLIGILDLNKVTVQEVMIPRHGIVGIDIEWPWEEIQTQLSKTEFDWLPIYRENINQILGLIHIRDLMHKCLSGEAITKDTLTQNLQVPYFIPEATPLNIQLLNFQKKKQKQRMAFVVDEYGDVHGLITVVDILEEIVGEFSTSMASGVNLIQQEADGSYLVNGGVSIREFNRMTHWQLPTRHSRTLNGLIIDYLETIPKDGMGVKIDDYPIEILEVQENRVKLARIFPQLKQ